MSLQELSDKTKNIIKELFREYYKKNELIIPNDFIMREFAFQTFDSDSYIRHKSFNSSALLKEYIVSIAPKHAYFSSAIYRDPGVENMDEKGWIGSDLIFDIDADDIPGCNPLKINLCISNECQDVELINEECVELAKAHEEELLDILVNDLGFTYDNVEVQFSGNRGFHTRVHPKDSSWLTLNSSARKEIVDYLKGIELDINYIIPLKDKKIKISTPNISEGGWRRRIAKKITDLRNVNLPEDLESLINRCLVKVDEKVTIDISRLIRIQESLNGKTGLKVTKLDPGKIHNFRIEEGLSPFTNYTAIILPTADIKGIKLLDHELDLTKYMSYRVPAAVAIYLALNKLAYIMKIL
ncbi:MAG: DNA primase small subunit PriS [Sulfolobales archaeon]